MSSTALIITEANKQVTLNKPLRELSSYSDFSTIAEQLIGSAFVPNHIPDVPTLASILLYGRELGYSPMSAMQNIINISGKLSLTASAMAAAIRQNGIRYTLDKDKEPIYGAAWVDPQDPSKGTKVSDVPTDYITEMTFYERWGDRIIENKMNVLWSECYIIATDGGKRALPSTYEKYTRHMLSHRLMTRAARLFCPEALAGNIYSPSELLMGNNGALTDQQMEHMFNLEKGFDVDNEPITVTYEDAEQVSDYQEE